MEPYELGIEEQAYPLEDKAIEVHKKNLELMTVGIYNEWIDKSLQKLAKFIPARYAKPEEESAVISSLDTYLFAIDLPEPPSPQSPEGTATISADSGPASAEAAEAAQVVVPTQVAKPAETKKEAQAENMAQGADDSGDQDPPPDVVEE
jgi:hypothetical protein